MLCKLSLVARVLHTEVLPQPAGPVSSTVVTSLAAGLLLLKQEITRRVRPTGPHASGTAALKVIPKIVFPSGGSRLKLTF